MITEKYLLSIIHYQRGKVDYQSELCFLDTNNTLQDGIKRVFEYCNDNALSNIVLSIFADSFIGVKSPEFLFAWQVKVHAPKTFYAFNLTLIKNDMRELQHTQAPYHLINFPF